MDVKDTEITKLPLGERFGLSIKEASAYFGIGVKNLRRMAETHQGGFSVYMGNRYLIIRPRLESYLLRCSEDGNTEDLFADETENT